MKKAFTIIELIISLIIFWIWIIVVITVLNRNIVLLKEVELKTKATMIAKDQIAVFYNFRDSNNIKYQKWNLITGSDYFQAWENYKVWTELSGNKNMIEKISHPRFSNTRLYIQSGTIINDVNTDVYTGFYYNYTTGQKTPFARYVNLTWVYLEPENNVEENQIMKLNSIVSYWHGNLSGKIILESFISNWKK